MKLEIPDCKKQAHQITLPVRWGDMDALGHVNNVVYFRYMEIIRVEWLRHIDCPLDPAGEGMVIVNAFCNFYRQLEYPCDVRLTMYTSDPARTTFETWYSMERADQPGVIHAAGGATAIWVNFSKQKAAPLPDWLRQIVSA